MGDPCRIAVTGMSCIFPGARDLSSFHHNLNTGFDAIREVPEQRWDKLYYDPDAPGIDRFYCRKGGFIDEYATFDPFAFGIMPVAAEGAEPDQLLSLKVSYDALKDAGYGLEDIPGERTGIILGRGNYIGSGMVRLEQHVRTAQQLVTSLKSLIPDISEKELHRVKTEFQKKLGNYGPDTAIGLVPNLTASRVANRLNFCGPAYTIDAACASSLMAIDQAAKALQYKQCDLMLAGGVHLCHDVSFWSVFTQLGILSKTETIKPFDHNADGVLIGEGIGVVVLKRYEDAVQDGDRIYSVINGIGVSSDGKASSLMFPDIGGQTLALERAWDMSGLKPENIGYIEAHGTGAPAGDTSELKTLAGFFKNRHQEEQKGNKPGLGSVKSMIGHCMPAAGVAGFIKTSLSLYHKKIFPTLNCSEPNKALEDTGFRLIQASEDWLPGDFGRIAGVNAFGFGGINVHVVMSEHETEKPDVAFTKEDIRIKPDDENILIISAANQQALLSALETAETAISEGPYRLVIFGPDEKKRAKAKKIIEKGLVWQGRGDIFYSPEGLSANGGKTAFLFPGVDSSFEPKLNDVADYFNKELPDCLTPGDLEETGVGIIRVNQFIHSMMTELGIKPDVMAGHSIGEWSGMIAAEIIENKSLDAFIMNLEAGSLEVPDVAFAAAGCDIQTAEGFINDLEDIGVSNDNCTHQVIVCGIDLSIDLMLDAMKKQGIFCQKLPFRSGFHSPLYADSLNVHRNKVEELTMGKMVTPLWSATTCCPYPEDKTELKQLMIDHLIHPVRFRELILKLYEDGVRIFIQSGTGRLSGFVQDILKGKEFTAINTNIAKKSGMQQLRRALAACFIEGLEPDLIASGMLTGSKNVISENKEKEMTLKLGVPLIQLETPLEKGLVRDRGTGQSGQHHNNPVINTYNDTLSEIALMQDEVLTSWQNRHFDNPAIKPNDVKRKLFELDISLESSPWLIDHSLFPQADSCTSIPEKYPVVPMTMSIDLLSEYAQKMVPGKKVIRLEKIQAFNWIDVCQPLKAEIEAEYDGVAEVRITIKGYLSGTVILDDDYPPQPEQESFKLENQKEAPVSADNLYKDGWMFHGPAYQGVKEIGSLGDNGILGVITPAKGRGSLLDNAGQLFGFWVMAMTKKDKLAMPIRLGKIEFFSDPPKIGNDVTCRIKIQPLKDKSASSDMEMAVSGKVWAIVTDWEDRRFDTDDTLFDVMKAAGTSMLSLPDKNGFLIYRDIYKTANATNYISRRYCTAAEKEMYDRIEPKRKRAWLNCLITLKDAVRNQLFSRGSLSVYPGEVSLIGNDSIGSCEAVGPSGKRYHIITSFEGDRSAAIIVNKEFNSVDFTNVFEASEDAINIGQ